MKSRPSSLTPRQARTRERIVAAADDIFCRFGWNRATMADIARALGMSTANIYKFFPSKSALVEACAEGDLVKMKGKLDRLARGRGGVLGRIEAIALAIYEKHRECFRHEQQMYELVILANEEQWACVAEFRAFLRETVLGLLKAGVRRGEFREVRPGWAAGVLLDSLAWIVDPLLFHGIDHRTVKARLQGQFLFFEKALK